MASCTHLPRGAKNVKHPWTNFKLSSKFHAAPGVYCVRHVKTQLCYVGAALSVFKALFSLSAKFRKGTTHNKLLAELYADDPHFEIEVRLLDNECVPEAVRREQAAKLSEQWKLELGQLCCNSQWFVRERKKTTPEEYPVAYRGEIDTRLLDRLWFNPEPAQQELATA